jgi:hypothetical protein
MLQNTLETVRRVIVECVSCVMFDAIRFSHPRTAAARHTKSAATSGVHWQHVSTRSTVLGDGRGRDRRRRQRCRRRSIAQRKQRRAGQRLAHVALCAGSCALDVEQRRRNATRSIGSGRRARVVVGVARSMCCCCCCCCCCCNSRIVFCVGARCGAGVAGRRRRVCVCARAYSAGVSGAARRRDGASGTSAHGAPALRRLAVARRRAAGRRGRAASAACRVARSRHVLAHLASFALRWCVCCSIHCRSISRTHWFVVR